MFFRSKYFNPKTNSFLGLYWALIPCLFLVGCIYCNKSNSTYIDVPVGPMKSRFPAAGNTDSFRDAAGNETVLSYSEYSCYWDEYHDYYPECTYLRYENCTQNVNVLTGESKLAHRLGISQDLFGYFFDEFRLADYISNVFDNHPYTSIDSLVIQDTTYYGLIQYDVPDTTSAIDKVIYSRNDRILKFFMKDGIEWERIH
jgi:hypothetical protein